MRFVLLIKVLAVALSVVLGLSFLGNWHFMLDNLSSFRVHFAILLVVCTVIFVTVGEFRWAGMAAAALIVSVYTIAPWYFSGFEEHASSGGCTIKVMASNVSAGLTEHNQLEKLVLQENPDIFGLIEITPRLLANLSKVVTEYPHRFEAPEEGFWGLALYAKLPLSRTRRVHFGIDVPAALSAMLHVAGSEVEVILIHPQPPMNTELARLRNHELEHLAAYIGKAHRPVIVLGDMNAALWSPHYHAFVEKSRLKNARQGFGVAATWPPTKVLGVPIDHIFYSKSMHSYDFRVLSPIGSDHLPISAKIGILNEPHVYRSGNGSGIAARGDEA